jgi:myo-inositol 2-dehydrogenase/D-chiro-inositol 1-dehydrogenase
MPLNMGVVGLGFMGKRYVEFLAQMPEARVVALCDVRREVAQQMAGALPASHGARAFADIHTLLAEADVNALCICTPEHLHVEAATAALRAGKAVMIEKPVAHTLAAAAEIAAVAATTNRPVMVGHLLRFEPRWAAAKAAIAAGDLGEIVSVATRRVGNILDQTVLQGRTSIPLYYGVHDLDIVRWLVGAEVVALYAARRAGVLHAAGYPIDDLYCAVLEFANGALGQAEIGWHIPASAVEAPTAGVTVTGTKGWLRVEQKESGFEYWSDRPRSLHPTFDIFFWNGTHQVVGGALANELRHFIHCAMHNSTPIITLEDGVEALRLALAMEASATAGRRLTRAEFG